MKGISYKHFLGASLLFGLIYVFIVPPFQAPDEDSHYFRCYEIFNSFQGDKQDPENRLGGYLPASLFKYSDQFRFMRFNYDGKITKEQLSTFNEKKLDKVNRNFTDFSNTAMYFPTAYPLQSIIAAIGASLNLRPSSILYLLRITTLLTWLIILYYAYKIFPGDKLLFLFISSLPAILVLHSSVTADAITNALAFLLFSYILCLKNQEGNISNFQIFKLGLIVLVLSINKIVYFPLILLWFFLPFGKFDSSIKYYSSFIIISLVCIFLTSIWALKVNKAYITYEDYAVEYRHDQQIKPKGDPNKQLEYVLSHSIEFTGNVIKSYLSVVPATAAHLTGKFGWEKNYIPTWMIALLCLCMIALIMNADFSLKIKERLLFIFIILSSLYLMAIMMYGLYSAVGNDYIFNLGGRYLFPLLPIIVIVFSRKFVKHEIKPSWILSIICISHITMIISILSRYYF